MNAMKSTLKGRKVGNFFVSSAFDPNAQSQSEYQVVIKNLTTLPFDIEVVSQIPEAEIARFSMNSSLNEKWEASFKCVSDSQSKRKCSVARLLPDEFRIQAASLRSKRAYWEIWDEEGISPMLEILVKD